MGLPRDPLYFFNSPLVHYLRQVLSQQIAAEDSVEVTPPRVDVIRVALCMVELDQKAWPLHPEIGHVAVPGPAGPGERDVLDAVIFDFCSSEGCDVIGHHRRVELDHIHE